MLDFLLSWKRHLKEVAHGFLFAAGRIIITALQRMRLHIPGNPARVFSIPWETPQTRCLWPASGGLGSNCARVSARVFHSAQQRTTQDDVSFVVRDVRRRPEVLFISANWSRFAYCGGRNGRRVRNRSSYIPWRFHGPRDATLHTAVAFPTPAGGWILLWLPHKYVY